MFVSFKFDFVDVCGFYVFGGIGEIGDDVGDVLVFYLFGKGMMCGFVFMVGGDDW